MLESFLSDFSFIKDTLDKEGDHNFFGRDFSFFSTEPILFYHSDRDAIVYVNSRFTDEFNYTVEDLAEWKYSIYPLLNTDDHEDFRKEMKTLLEYDGESMPDANYRLVAKNNKHSYYRVKVRKLHKAYYFIQLENSARTAVPVLKNKTADELMHEAEAILKFGFWMWDASLDKLFWTKGMYHLMEYEEVENLSPSMSFLSDHIIRDENYDDFQKRLNEGQIKDSYRVKYQLHTGKDNIINVSEHGRIEHDEQGKVTRIIGLTRNITLQEQSMKNLADYKKMMQENETFLNYGTWESNADGSVINWTNGMYEMFGFDEAERDKLAIDRDLYLRHIISPDPSVTDPADFINDKESYRTQFEIKDAKGVTKMLSTYAKIIRDNENTIQKIIGTTCDITQLKEHEKILEQKIEELNKSNTELEEFAYVASHDMQEPLRKISTFGQRLKTQYAGELSEDANLYLSRMLNASENMRNLIDNLLEFSRVSRNKQPYEKVELSDVLKNVTDDLDMHIDETGTSISVEPMPEIQAIQSQMRQLFFNLLHNAIKFRKKDRKLAIQVKQRKLTNPEKKSFQLLSQKEYYMITVQDNGIGFEQQYAERIFQLFQRLEGKSEYPGTGIGLSICRKIVTNHKGQIFADSKPGEGTVFSIILPKDQ
ncbi:MAG: ATP-binding protein [Bacteroidota bacterium]